MREPLLSRVRPGVRALVESYQRAHGHRSLSDAIEAMILRAAVQDPATADEAMAWAREQVAGILPAPTKEENRS